MNPAPPTATSAPPSRAVTRVYLLAATVAALAAAATAVLPMPRWDTGEVAAGMGLLALVAVTERWSLTVRIGHETHRLTLSELPLVIGLFTLQPVTLVLVRVVGCLLALRVLRRQVGFKSAYNAAYLWLETIAAIAVVWVVGPSGITDGIAGTAAVLAVALVVSATSATAMTGAISAMEGRLVPGLLAQAFTDQIGPTVATAAAASIGLALAFTAPQLLWAPVVILAVLSLAYRAHLGLIATQQVHHQLLAFTRGVTGDGDLQTTAAQVVEAARALVSAPLVALRLERDGGGSDPRWVGVPPAVGAAIEHTLSLQEGHHVPSHGCCASPDLDVTLAPLDSLDGGWIAVGFEPGRQITALERQAVGMIANHAAVAMANARRGTTLRVQAQEASHRALHDPLTDLPNRRALKEELQRRIDEGSHFALLLMDLNDFKEINDALGHAAGDTVLVEVARRLGPLAEDAWMVARLGGDEFAAIVGGGEATARELAERLTVQIGRPVTVGPYTIEVSASIGVAMHPTHGGDSDELLKNADLAMYEAKADRGGTSVFGAAAGGRAVRQLAISSGFRAALQAGDITVAAQPIIDLADGRLVGVEALARWTHPELGPIRPDEFVMVAEQAGLITDLTHTILDRILGWQRRWAAEGLDLQVAVNLSARSLRDTELPRRIARQLDEHGVPADRLTLELTESSVISDPQRTIAVLTRLAGMGVKLAIDDFGTGYSSLAYLRQIPAHEVKIDKSFVLPLDTDDSAAPLVSGIIRLCHELGYDVVAEGIESRPVQLQLQAMGCDRAQGYHIARPMPPEELLAWQTQHLRVRPPGLRLLGT